MSDVFHFLGNVNPVVIEQIFLLSVSSLSGTCTNFLELFTVLRIAFSRNDLISGACEEEKEMCSHDCESV